MHAGALDARARQLNYYPYDAQSSAKLAAATINALASRLKKSKIGSIFCLTGSIVCFISPL